MDKSQEQHQRDLQPQATAHSVFSAAPCPKMPFLSLWQSLYLLPPTSPSLAAAA
jgi:hypothetical protein